MNAPTHPRIRWYHVTPGRFVLALLIIEALLWLSDRLGCWHKGYAVLTAVDLTGTQVTDAGVATLQKALPNCKIIR
jgi:hypothetical protein